MLLKGFNISVTNVPDKRHLPTRGIWFGQNVYFKIIRDHGNNSFEPVEDGTPTLDYFEKIYEKLNLALILAQDGAIFDKNVESSQAR